MRDFMLTLPREKTLGQGRGLRLLSAWEELEAKREAHELAADGTEYALCANACVLARALHQKGKPVFSNGREALEGLTAGEISALACQWRELDRSCNPSVLDGEGAVDEAKKAWSTRLISAFSGVCSRLLGRFPPRREFKK